jgi:hypothetical protein
MTKRWLWNKVELVALAVAVLSCDQKAETTKKPQEDKAKQAVREAVTREFQYYEGAKEKLGEAEKQEQQRREQEKQLQ